MLGMHPALHGHRTQQQLEHSSALAGRAPPPIARGGCEGPPPPALSSRPRSETPLRNWRYFWGFARAARADTCAWLPAPQESHPVRHTCSPGAGPGTMSHPPQFYAKVAGACFLVGGAMELFMIKTGFYNKVTELEAQRLEETREDRQAFKALLRAEIERQAKEKNIRINLPDS